MFLPFLIFLGWILVHGQLAEPSVASGGRVPEVWGGRRWSGCGGQGANVAEDLVEQGRVGDRRSSRAVGVSDQSSRDADQPVPQSSDHAWPPRTSWQNN